MKQSSTPLTIDQIVETLSETHGRHSMTAEDMNQLEGNLRAQKEYTSNSTFKVSVEYYLHLIRHKSLLDQNYEVYALNLVKMLEQIQDSSKIAKIYRDLSIYYRKIGNFSSSYDSVSKSLEIYERLGDIIKIAITLNTLGNFYLDKGDWSLALENYHKAYENIKTEPYTDAYYIIKNNLANIYLYLNYYSKAKAIYFEDIDILRSENNLNRYAAVLQGIAEVYLAENRHKLAYKYGKQSLDIWEKTTDAARIANAHITFGNILSHFEKYEDALAYYNKSREKAESLGMRVELLKINYLTGELYLKKNELDRALEFLLKAQATAEDINQIYELRKIYNLLYKTFEGLGQEKEAYQTIKKMTNLNESIFNFSLQAKVNEVQVNYELEKREIEYNKEREINEYKNNLFSYITHEFRTPLTLISTPLEMIRNENDVNIIKSRLSGVSSHIVHMQHLLDQLLDIHKIEEGKMPILKKAGNISPLFWHIVHLYEPEMSDKNIDFVYNMPRKNIQAYFDTDKIEKIINNLLSNAIKYTKAGGKIVFNADFDKTSSNLVIEVRDNGIGIDEKYQTEIFNKFYRIPSNKDVKGSGLGLSFVKELVTLLNGEIILESKPQQGTKFIVTIPIERIEKLDKKVKVILDDTINAQKQPTLLIVEDNYEILKLLKEVFSEKYKVMTADHGREAVSKMQKNPPDLVISDVMMPLMNGIELCQYIKQNDTLSYIPVILLSAKSSITDRIDGLGSGADAYITKPFNIAELMQTVETTLSQRKKMIERFSNKNMLSNSDELMSADRVFIEKVTEFVLANIENENLSVNDLAKDLNMSRFTLIRRFKKVNDSTPNVFIQKIRLEKAKEMIRNKVANVTEIAYKVGFGSTTYFSYSFKKEFGVTPKEYYQSEVI